VNSLRWQGFPKKAKSTAETAELWLFFCFSQRTRR